MPIVILWQMNNGENSEDYRGGTVRDVAYLYDQEIEGRTVYSYTSDLKRKARKFDSVDEARQYLVNHWLNGQSNTENLIESVDSKGRLMITWKGSMDDSNNQFIFKSYQPRS